MDKKLQDFNYTVGIILAKLYEPFPRRISLSNQDLAGYGDYKQCIDTAGRYTYTFEHKESGTSVEIQPEVFQYYWDTLRWLEREDLITGALANWGIGDATLTMKGLNFLNLNLDTPDEESQDISLATKLMKAIASGTKDQVADFVGKAIASFVFASAGKS